MEVPELSLCTDLCRLSRCLGAQAGMVWLDHFDILRFAVVVIRVRLSQLIQQNLKGQLVILVLYFDFDISPA